MGGKNQKHMTKDKPGMPTGNPGKTKLVFEQILDDRGELPEAKTKKERNQAKDLINKIGHRPISEIYREKQKTIWKIGTDDDGMRIDKQGHMGGRNKDKVNIQLQTNTRPKDKSVTLANVLVPDHEKISTSHLIWAMNMSMNDRVKVEMKLKEVANEDAEAVTPKSKGGQSAKKRRGFGFSLGVEGEPMMGQVNLAERFCAMFNMFA